jgi:hypothetical protein
MQAKHREGMPMRAYVKAALLGTWAALLLLVA